MFLHRSRHATLARLTAATFPAITLACPLSDHLHSPFCRFISLILCVFSCLLVVSPPPRLGLLHLFPFPNLKLHFSPTALPVAPLLPTPAAVSPITSLLPPSISISSLVLSEASQLISDLSHNWSPDYIKKTKSAPHYCSVVELSLSRISLYSGESPVSFIPLPWETH